MATVTTASGDVLEGVQGAELDYYRGQQNLGDGTRVVEDAAEQAAVFPQVFEDGVRVELPDAPVELIGEPVVADQQTGELTGEVQDVVTGERSSVLTVPVAPADGTPVEISNDPPAPRRR